MNYLSSTAMIAGQLASCNVSDFPEKNDDYRKLILLVFSTCLCIYSFSPSVFMVCFCFVLFLLIVIFFKSDVCCNSSGNE